MKYTNGKELIKEIRQIMLREDINIKELSSRINKSQSNTSKILSQDTIKLDTLNKICEALHYNLMIDIVKDDTE